MTIRVCDNCNGDGFWRMKTADIDLLQNIYHASYLYPDGTRISAMDIASIAKRGRPELTEFNCFKCSGTGEVDDAPAPRKRNSLVSRIAHFLVPHH